MFPSLLFLPFQIINRTKMKKYLIIIAMIGTMVQPNFAQTEDPWEWLENVDSEKSLQWVEQWNEKSLKTLKTQEDYQNIFEKNLEILNSTDRIASPSFYGDYIYNFWQDKHNPRGVWRRTTRESYLRQAPQWEILLDIDELSKKDGIQWVFKGASGLFPDYDRFLVNLSKGGGDAVVIKEFDVNTKSFPEDGFQLPEAKGSANWIDLNTLMVSTDFGEGITTSGYPRQVKIWKRGTSINDAREVFNGQEDDMGIWGYTVPAEDKVYQLITRRTSFYSGSYMFLEDNELIEPELPDDIELTTIFNGQVIFQLKSDWKLTNQTFSQGAVISIGYDDLIAGKKN